MEAPRPPWVLRCSPVWDYLLLTSAAAAGSLLLLAGLAALLHQGPLMAVLGLSTLGFAWRPLSIRL